jgi:hypothetical protein
MNAVTTAAPEEAPANTEPIPLYPGPEMVPVTLTRVEPLPPPPRQGTRTAAVRAGTAIAGIGCLFALIGLFLVPWFQVNEITITSQPSQAVASSQSSQNNTQTLTNNGRFGGPMRDLHDLGVAGWASTRREKRDVAILVLVLVMGTATLVGSMAYRWRLAITLAGVTALAAFLLTLLDYLRLEDLVRRRLTFGFGAPSAAVTNLRLGGTQPGTGMVAVLAGLAIVLFGISIALISGRRGKLLTPLSQ